MSNTGPNTVEGKLIVSHNAVRHGLRTRAIVIPGIEQQDDWDQFREDVVEAFNTGNAIEYALAERAAELLWRLRRASRAESDAAIAHGKRDAFDADLRRKEDERQLKSYGAHSGAGAVIARRLETPDPPAATRVLPDLELLSAISTYEARLSRQLLHTLHELEAMQERRAGRAAPLARIDVSLAAG